MWIYRPLRSSRNERQEIPGKQRVMRFSLFLRALGDFAVKTCFPSVNLGFTRPRGDSRFVYFPLTTALLSRASAGVPRLRGPIRSDLTTDYTDALGWEMFGVPRSRGLLGCAHKW
jgi:hypothetical protein